MNSTSLSQKKLRVEAVVELAREVAGAQAPTGRLVVRENLGPGVVREISLGGEVRVHWPLAALDTWVATRDLEQAGPQARLITIYRYGPGGHYTLDKCKVIKDKGLCYNWTVEFLPENIIRAMRSDGLAWTFDWNPMLERVEPQGTIIEDELAEDEHAEALTVAELAAT